MARKKPAQKRLVTCPGCGHRADPGTGPLNFCPDCGAPLRAAQPAEESGDLIGRVIADRYRLIARVGEGGMGSVYKAEHIRMGKALALKILPGNSSDPSAVDRFHAEAQIVSRLSHQHTIGVFDFGEIGPGGGFYLAMEYVPGKDVATVLRESGPLPEARAAEIGQQVLGSLAEAHDAGIVHRDMKPGNVMLMRTRSGEDFVKVLDFGIAKLRDEPTPTAEASTTAAGAIVGTPNYLAPEQARAERVDARADIYAVGCLLYELVSGAPPFAAPTPMAVISAHLTQEPPPLASKAPGVSKKLADAVHRALQKRPEDRFASADEMRDALLALGDTSGAHRAPGAAAPEATGGLGIASREDFAELDRRIRALRRGRIAVPIAAMAVAAVLLAAWRWGDIYGLIALRAPALAQALPAPLRPAALYDGDEHEPNDVPGEANPLPLPPGQDGRPGGGIAVVRGHVGAKLSATAGDVDIFKLVVPPTIGRKVLVAEWHGEKAGEGIRGLDVSLALNRETTGPGGRVIAPLVAAASGGGPGRPERLVAAVEPGTYYLAVREEHGATAAPVEKPTDVYVLEVRLADPAPGVEVEPNDSPDRPSAVPERYQQWRNVAERNALGEGVQIRGSTRPGDLDTYAIEPRGPDDAPRLAVAVPEPELALDARLWVPDAQDLAVGPAERVRFEAAGAGAPGQTIAVALAATPAPGSPALLQLRASAGAGSYDVVALGAGVRSRDAALALVRALADAGRPAQALEVAAAFATRVPEASGRADVLLLAGRIAEEAAQAPIVRGTDAFERASWLLGTAVLEPEGGSRRYHGAFESLATGEGPAADEAALRLVRLASPCTPDGVVARADAFLGRKPEPAPDLAREARLARARGIEQAFWATGGKDRTRLAAALEAWEPLATEDGSTADEAAARSAALGAKRPSRSGARRACP